MTLEEMQEEVHRLEERVHQQGVIFDTLLHRLAELQAAQNNVYYAGRQSVCAGFGQNFN